MHRINILVVLMAVPALGYTNCTSFSDVTVPATDNLDPLVGFKFGQVGGSGSTTVYGDVTRNTSDYSTDWGIVPFGVDLGGMRKLQALTSWGPAPGCTVITAGGFFNPAVDTQPAASPGDTVTNGIYLLRYISPSDIVTPSTCPISYRVTVSAEDYAGNVSTAVFRLNYTP